MRSGGSTCCCKHMMEGFGLPPPHPHCSQPPASRSCGPGSHDRKAPPRAGIHSRLQTLVESEQQLGRAFRPNCEGNTIRNDSHEPNERLFVSGEPSWLHQVGVPWVQGLRWSDQRPRPAGRLEAAHSRVE